MNAVASVPDRTSARLTARMSDWWYLFWKLVMSAFFKMTTFYRIEGREHEPRRGPFIATGNHASAADPLIIGAALRHRAAFMAKAELFAVPVVGPWLRSIGSFPVRRGQPDRSAIRRSHEVLNAGGVLMMFPEGTRSPDGRLQEPEPGAALLALRTGVPVLPVAVVNSHRAMPKGSPIPRFRRVTVRIGRPFAVSKIEGRLDHQLLNEWGQRIMAEIAKLLPEDQKPLV